MGTRTGGYAIGFRRGWSDWQKDLSALAAWAKQSGFDLIDLGRASAQDVQTLKSNGLRVGSVDLIGMGQISFADPTKRKDLVAQNVAYVKEAAGLGAKVFFTIIPGDPNKKREENYAIAIEAFAPIAQACAAAGASLAVEGWPGGSPHLANLCCTPETVRAFIKDVGAGAGVNYDPSHLIRLGVDHIQFLAEFAPHIRHVHAKDTDIYYDAIYEYGTQRAAFAPGHGFGENTWRYTIPGHGLTRWVRVMELLKAKGYAGAVSVELEDENFNGTEAGEKAGLVHSLNYLRGV